MSNDSDLPPGDAGDRETPTDDTGAPSNQPAVPGEGRVLTTAEKRLAALQHPNAVAMRGRWGKVGAPKPAGRPKSLPRFRKACRDDAFKVKAEIMRRIAVDSTEGKDGSPAPNSIPMKELVQAFAELSDRGSFLKGKEEADLDAAKARLILTAMALEGLTADQRAKLLEAINGD